MSAMSDAQRSDSTPLQVTELYQDLQRLAERQFRRQPAGHTLQATALVNEAWLRLAGRDRQDDQSRSHFLAVAAKTMRHVLVDHARRSRASKRGGDAQRLEIQSGVNPVADEPQPDVLDLDAALARLTEQAPRQARVVELKFFSGMTLEEIGAVLGVSDTIISKEWKKARLWLARELES
jgi:RNA polymerase sigma factor (TIGR02999 family)